MQNLFLVYSISLYMLQAYLIPSSRGTTVCIQSNATRTTHSHLKRTISTNCYIHTIVPPDDGPRYARNTYRLTEYTKNKLCNRLGVSLPNYIDMHDQQSIKLNCASCCSLTTATTTLIVYELRTVKSREEKPIYRTFTLTKTNGNTLDEIKAHTKTFWNTPGHQTVSHSTSRHVYNGNLHMGMQYMRHTEK